MLMVVSLRNMVRDLVVGTDPRPGFDVVVAIHAGDEVNEQRFYAVQATWDDKRRQLVIEQGDEVEAR